MNHLTFTSLLFMHIARHRPRLRAIVKCAHQTQAVNPERKRGEEREREALLIWTCVSFFTPRFPHYPAQTVVCTDMLCRRMERTQLFIYIFMMHTILTCNYAEYEARSRFCQFSRETAPTRRHILWKLAMESSLLRLRRALLYVGVMCVTG